MHSRGSHVLLANLSWAVTVPPLACRGCALSSFGQASSRLCRRGQPQCTKPVAVEVEPLHAKAGYTQRQCVGERAK